ncbi:ABC transporter ATP-binding protein [Microtetraspora malaysiensis]|uniref:ABC transporter ATP-binding protein n=1 Tax=Microtetraspora malaysiensis TaxID=161358 RepID=UPI000833A0F3|nr:ABC transporter ATP-binding protein [Microtetraspora malaysiensis]
MDEPLLTIEDLAVQFPTEDGLVKAVDGVFLDVRPGEVVGVVGESGSGKSVTAMSVLGLVRRPGRITRGRIRFRGRNLLDLSPRALRAVRGGEIAMVFQDPMTALNPVVPVGRQIAEAVRLHGKGLSRGAVRDRVIELLASVGVPNPATRYRQFPHEYSGGMRQRAMIAMAMANEPALLIADEPTTALDVTIQAQVLDLLRSARERTGAAAILITHDLGVIAELADRVAVMYAGRVVEQGDVHAVFDAPRHPYTRGLMASRPRIESSPGALVPIPGSPPSMLAPPPGCPFHPRCPIAADREPCRISRPGLTAVGAGHATACHFHEELA